MFALHHGNCFNTLLQRTFKQKTQCHTGIGSTLPHWFYDDG